MSIYKAFKQIILPDGRFVEPNVEFEFDGDVAAIGIANIVELVAVKKTAKAGKRKQNNETESPNKERK